MSKLKSRVSLRKESHKDELVQGTKKVWAKVKDRHARGTCVAECGMWRCMEEKLN